MGAENDTAPGFDDHGRCCLPVAADETVAAGVAVAAAAVVAAVAATAAAQHWELEQTQVAVP